MKNAPDHMTPDHPGNPNWVTLIPRPAVYDVTWYWVGGTEAGE